MKKSIKRITALGVSAMLLFALSACGSKKEDSGYDQNPDESEEGNETSYYSCLTEDGDGLKFDVTPEEFLERYNSLKASYEDDNYGDIELSDFSYVGDETSINGTATEAYACSQTIIGERSDLAIWVNRETNGSSITSVSLGIKNDLYYSDEMLPTIRTQYELLICALTGCDMSTAEEYTIKMMEDDDAQATYDRGIAFHIDVTSSSHWCGIQPCTREQYDNALNG